MPVPTLITDLSTTISANAPAGSESVFPNLDDYMRATSGFIASIRDNTGNGWVSPYLTTTTTAAYLTAPGPIGGTTPNTISGTTGTFSGAVSGTTGTFSGAVSGTTGAFTGGVQTAPVSAIQSTASITINCNLSNVFATTLTASITLPTYSNPHDGQTINWFITQGGAGSFTIAWGGVTAVKWPGGTAGVLSTAVGAVDLAVLTYRSSTGFWYATLSKAFA